VNRRSRDRIRFILALAPVAFGLVVGAGFVYDVWKEPRILLMVAVCVLIAVPVCIALDAVHRRRQRRQDVRGFEVVRKYSDHSD
jgi:peptidoglycan/LPS O-acetylase OafA/YrhL